MVEERRAEELAQALLATELPRRWWHSVGIAGQADRLAAAAGFDGDLLVAAAWLHDIGYSSHLADTGFIRSTVPGISVDSARMSGWSTW